MANLYMIPVTLGECNLDTVIPSAQHNIIMSLSYFIVENIRTARRFLKKTDHSIDINKLHFFELNQHTNVKEIGSFLKPISEGNSIGLMSEAGCPGVADPGSEIVRIAHRRGIKVIPMVGPSSIILALMASGMNGQNFAFNGYLPAKKDEKSKKIDQLENRISTEDQSQIFIEAPYRNIQLLSDLLIYARKQTRLCIACDITLPTEFIRTKTIAEWKNSMPDIQKRPTIFILGK